MHTGSRAITAGLTVNAYLYNRTWDLRYWETSISPERYQSRPPTIIWRLLLLRDEVCCKEETENERNIRWPARVGINESGEIFSAKSQQPWQGKSLLIGVSMMINPTAWNNTKCSTVSLPPLNLDQIAKGLALYPWRTGARSCFLPPFGRRSGSSRLTILTDGGGTSFIYRRNTYLMLIENVR